MVGASKANKPTFAMKKIQPNQPRQIAFNTFLQIHKITTSSVIFLFGQYALVHIPLHDPLQRFYPFRVVFFTQIQQVKTSLAVIPARVHGVDDLAALCTALVADVANE